ncbi:MAG: hypothetical protein AAFR93_16520 [Pseudomonadota bacterium]
MTRNIWLLLAAGAFATLAFDIVGQSLSPLFGQSRLAPVPLANAVLKTVFGSGHRPSAYMLHILTGLLAYPLAWALVVAPLSQRLTPQIPTLLISAFYGIALWVFALYGMAHLVAGMKPFLGFTNITWVALVGHVIYAIVLSESFTRLSRAQGQPASA